MEVFITRGFEIVPTGIGTVAMSFETSAIDGYVHLVILPANADVPGWSEIEAGTDANGHPAIFAKSIQVWSIDLAFSIKPVLANGTTYRAFAFHRRGDWEGGELHGSTFTMPP